MFWLSISSRLYRSRRQREISLVDIQVLQFTFELKEFLKENKLLVNLDTSVTSIPSVY